MYGWLLYSRLEVLSIVDFSQCRHVDVDVAWAQVQVYCPNDNEGCILDICSIGTRTDVHLRIKMIPFSETALYSSVFVQKKE
jgi:hypothetical protein